MQNFKYIFLLLILSCHAQSDFRYREIPAEYEYLYKDTPEKRAGAPDPRSSGAVKKDGKLRVSARCSGSSARTDRCEGIRQRQFPVLMTLACKPVAFVYVEAMGWR